MTDRTLEHVLSMDMAKIEAAQEEMRVYREAVGFDLEGITAQVRAKLLQEYEAEKARTPSSQHAQLLATYQQRYVQEALKALTPEQIEAAFLLVVDALMRSV